MAWGFAALYMGLQGYYLYHWIKSPVYKPTIKAEIKTGASVIIIARNESGSIQACLKSLLHQSFPKELYEIIIIDDHSNDDTIDKIRELQNGQIQCFRLRDYPEYIYEPAYKKSGITLGIDKSRFETIIVTDADCLFGEDWLHTTLDSFLHSNSVFQTGPVILSKGDTLLEKMQEAEQLTLMLITGAGISSGLHDIASGANMVFSKDAFRKVKGYQGNYHYASGDDMFLIEKMRTAFPTQISFLKSAQAAVYTGSKKTWDSLIQQRLRWAGKNKGLDRRVIKNLWSFVGLYHLFLILTFATAVFALTPWKPFLILLVGKWLADYFVINSAAAFFHRSDLVRLFVPLQTMYFGYIIRLSLAMGLGKKGDWRG